MGIVQATIRTSTCNNCGITATFEISERGVAKEVVDANPWLKTGRVVNTPDGRVLFYCTDECEVKGTASGAHNILEPKRIADVSANAGAIAQAAAAAQRQEQADKALRAGGPVTL